jgi:hypothetical protein
MRSDDFGQEGKIDQPEKYMRRIKGPKLERRANHSTLRQNCTYNYSAKGWAENSDYGL